MELFQKSWDSMIIFLKKKKAYNIIRGSNGLNEAFCFLKKKISILEANIKSKKI